MGAMLSGGGGGGGRRGARSRRRSGQPMSEINVTPFVDVMLVLLIIFMVSAPLLTPGVGIDLPRVSEAKTLQRPTKPPVPVNLAENGAIFYGDEEMSFAQLTERLQEARDAGGSDRVYLRAAATLEYEKVAKLIVQLTNAGYANIAFITAEPSQAAALPAQGGDVVDLNAPKPAGGE